MNMGSLLKPRSLFLLMLLAVFLIEVVVMLLLNSLPELPWAVEMVLDAFLLSLIFVPFLYQFFLKPYQTYVQLHSQAEAEREKSRELNRLKSEIISVASHELRTPLAVITGYSELLQTDGQFTEKNKKEFAAHIIRKAEMMERLIDDLLDLSNIEQGRALNINPERNDLGALATMIVEDYRIKHPKRLFALKLPAEPVEMLFDKVRIEQVFDNLLSNAVKFSPDSAPIEVVGEFHDHLFECRIIDRGIGLSPEQLRHVFDKIYRVDASNTSAGGLGLGMSIVKQIITSHGGDIRLDSKPGEGTTVTFTLPAV
jgi:signal transduction histidine kinase